MAEARDNAYVWVTWLTKPLSGETQCLWATWFQAHHKYDKLPSDFDLIMWRAKHAEMVRCQAEALIADGYQVRLEGQNKFKLPGNDIQVTLGGQPDIVAFQDQHVLVIDCKTGRHRDSDLFQVMIYMLLLPYVNGDVAGKEVSGSVQYSDGTVPISSDKVDENFLKLFRGILRRVAADEPPMRVSSSDECRFCDIGPGDCPERTTDTIVEQVVEHHVF